jgi:hypothetical protein
MEPFRDESELARVVAAFENCSYGKDDFGHPLHLVVAVWYLSRHSENEALALMRTGLLRFLRHHELDVEIYNETVTLFWLKVIRKFVSELSRGLTIVDVTNAVVKEFLNSKFAYEYYSEELLKSSVAKSGWVEPDLRPL